MVLTYYWPLLSMRHQNSKFDSDHDVIGPETKNSL